MLEEMRRFKRSLKHALDGIGYAIMHEKNFRLELLIGFLVLILMGMFHVKPWEAIVLVFMIMWVLVFELINTVLERVVDILKPRIHPYARLIKDLMAGVVLICATVSLFVGILIFYPYIQDILINVFLH